MMLQWVIIVKFSRREDEYTSEMVVTVEDVDIMVPTQVLKQPLDVGNKHFAQEVGQQEDGKYED